MANASDDKAIARLVRKVLQAPLEISLVKAGEMGDAVRLAQRGGLVRVSAGKVLPTPEARTWLKRHLSGVDESFATQHRDLVGEMRDEGSRQLHVQFNRNESPLSAITRLKDRNGAPFLPREAVAAGERLHADFTRGQLQPRVTQSFEPRLFSPTRGGKGGMEELCDSAMAARMRVGKAVDAMGPELSGVALDICCFQKGLETVERERQWPARSAKLMLKTALLALHRHYTPAPRAQMRHWGETGYRPEV